MFSRFAARRRGSPVVLLHEFHAPPYGGGNQFLLALRDELVRRGTPVGVGDVGTDTEVVLFNSHHADAERLRAIRRPGLRMVHRVDGPIAAYRGRDDGTDRRVLQLNHEFADATIFQSQYSLESHLALGLTFREPHVIANAANPGIFFPATDHQLGARTRVISSSWSDNPRKGGPVYAWLDAHLDQQRHGFTFVGRIAVDLPHSRRVEAVPSNDLAELLRAQDIYLAASEADPCSNALIEALSCGLPAIFRRSGGHPELVKDGGLGFDHQDEIPGLIDQIRAKYDDYRRRVSAPKLVDVADAYAQVLGIKAASA